MNNILLLVDTPSRVLGFNEARSEVEYKMNECVP